MRKKVVAAACTAATVLTVTGVAQAQELNAIPDVVRTLDGSGNNVRNPAWGQANTQYLRVAPANYADGIERAGRRAAARVRQQPHLQRRRQNLFSENGVTQWGFAWGQFLDHTFGLRAGGRRRERADRVRPRATRWRSFTNELVGAASTFTRTPAAPGTGAGATRRASRSTPSAATSTRSPSTATPRAARVAARGPGRRQRGQQRRPAAARPDGYLPRRDARGNAATRAARWRSWAGSRPTPGQGDGGRRRAREREHRAHRDPHAVRAEHNRIVDALPRALSEEAKFQIARRVVGAEQQFITYNEFLPGARRRRSRAYRGYDPNVNATPRRTSSPSSGYRAHSMIHGELEPSAPAGTYTAAQLERPSRRMGIEVEREGDQVELVIPLNLAFGNPDLLHERRRRAGAQRPRRRAAVQATTSRSTTSSAACCSRCRGRGTRRALPRRAAAAGLLPAASSTSARSTSSAAATTACRSTTTCGGPTAWRRRPRSRRSPASRPTASRPTRDQRRQPDQRSRTSSTSSSCGTSRATRSSSAARRRDADAVAGVRRTTLAARLKAIYGNVDKLDAFVGMVSERHVAGTEFGELQLAIWTQAVRGAARRRPVLLPERPGAARDPGAVRHRLPAHAGPGHRGQHHLDVQPNVFEVVPD